MTTYPKPERPVHSREAADWIEEIHAMVEVLGLRLPVTAAARKKIAHARDLRKQQAELRESRDQISKRIARQLVAGELDFESAALEATKAEALARGSILDRAIRRTENLAIGQAFNDVAGAVDGDVLLDQCRAIVAAALDEIRSLRPTLDGIRDAEAATAAGTKVATAWVKYRTELVPRWDAAHELIAKLRRLHWIEPLPILGRPGDRAGARYGRPDLMREDVQAAKRARQLKPELLDPIADRWEPGGPFTEDELRQAQRILDEQLGQALQAQDEARERRGEVTAFVRGGV